MPGRSLKRKRPSRRRSLRRKPRLTLADRLEQGLATLRRKLVSRPAPSTPRDRTAKRIRRLELQTDRLVRSIVAGEYRSVFKGRGMIFDEVREYQEGDDPRTIDWNVTARMDRLFVKKYVEERELTVILAVDVSASLDFATVGDDLKRDLAARFAMTVALSAMANHDRVGLFLFGAGAPRFVPPRRGRTHVLRLVRDLLEGRGAARAPGQATFTAAMTALSRVLRQPATVFVCSDFLFEDLEALRKLSRHDVVAVTLSDRAEQELPDVGKVAFMDPETGASAIVDTSDPAVQTRYSQLHEVRRRKRQHALRAMGVDEVELRTGDSFWRPVFAFFRRRSTRRLRPQRTR